MTDELPSDDGTASPVSRRRVLQATGAAALGGVAFTGTASAHECCVDCERLGKVDRTPRKNDTYEFDYSEGTITITVVDVTKTDGEVKCVKLDVTGGSLCKVAVKGGPGARVREYNPSDCECNTDWCGTTSTYPCAPFNENSGKLYEISNITFYACLTETRNSADDGKETKDDNDRTQTKHDNGKAKPEADGDHGPGEPRRGRQGRGPGRSRGRGRKLGHYNNR